MYTFNLQAVLDHRQYVEDNLKKELAEIKQLILDKKAASNRVLTIKEISKKLQISVCKTYQRAEKGSIPVRKIGSEWRGLESDIEEYMRKGGSKTNGNKRHKSKA